MSSNQRNNWKIVGIRNVPKLNLRKMFGNMGTNYQQQEDIKRQVYLDDKNINGNKDKLRD